MFCHGEGGSGRGEGGTAREDHKLLLLVDCGCCDGCPGLWSCCSELAPALVNIIGWGSTEGRICEFQDNSLALWCEDSVAGAACDVHRLEYGSVCGRGFEAGAGLETGVGEMVVAEAERVLGIFPSGKFSFALKPLNLVAAISYAIAASSAVSNVPSQTRAAFLGSRISAAHFPHGRWRTPRYLRFFTGGDGEGVGVASLPCPLRSPGWLPPPSNCSNPLDLRIWGSAAKDNHALSAYMMINLERND